MVFAGKHTFDCEVSRPPAIRTFAGVRRLLLPTKHITKKRMQADDIANYLTECADTDVSDDDLEKWAEDDLYEWLEAWEYEWSGTGDDDGEWESPS